MVIRKLGALLGVASVAFAAAACGGGGTPAPSAGAGCTVGVSWNNYQEERWAKWDEPAIKKAIEAAAASTSRTDAKSSAETQPTNVENLISQGAKVVVILAQDGTAIKPSVARRDQQGRPVVAYDRLIEDPGVLYITFDNKLVGKMQAEALLKVKDSGNFVVIKGNKADANADFLRAAWTRSSRRRSRGSGALKTVGERYTDNWIRNAQTKMEKFLTANDNKIDAVRRERRHGRWRHRGAQAAQGLAGKVPVSGQDGDAAALNRVALGTQTVDVWKDARLLGKAAGEAAVRSAPTRTRHGGRRRPVPTPGGNDHDSIFLTPEPITRTTSTSSSTPADHQGRPLQGRQAGTVPWRLIVDRRRTPGAGSAPAVRRGALLYS